MPRCDDASPGNLFASTYVPQSVTVKDQTMPVGGFGYAMAG
jgi:hypothetical protein